MVCLINYISLWWGWRTYDGSPVQKLFPWTVSCTSCLAYDISGFSVISLKMSKLSSIPLQHSKQRWDGTFLLQSPVNLLSESSFSLFSPALSLFTLSLPSFFHPSNSINVFDIFPRPPLLLLSFICPSPRSFPPSISPPPPSLPLFTLLLHFCSFFASFPLQFLHLNSSSRNRVFLYTGDVTGGLFVCVSEWYHSPLDRVNEIIPLLLASYSLTPSPSLTLPHTSTRIKESICQRCQGC